MNLMLLSRQVIIIKGRFFAPRTKYVLNEVSFLTYKFDDLYKILH